MDGNMDKRTYGSIMGLLGAISCTGHFIIALALRKNTDLKKKHHFLLSLGMSDALIAFHAFLSTAAAFSQQWPFGDFVCLMDAYFGMAATFASVAFAQWIATMQFYRVCRPGKYVNVKFHARLEWFYALLGGLLPIIGFGEYGYETDNFEYRTGCLLTFRNVGIKYWIYLIFISICWFFVPLYKIFISYRNVSKAQNHCCKLQYLVPMQIILSLTPYAIFAFATIAYNVSVLSGFYVAVNNISAKIMIATNPFIYVMSDPELQQLCAYLLQRDRVAEKVEETKSE